MVTSHAAPYQFYECGAGTHFHPRGFDGDCRDDHNRFSLDELYEEFPGWEEVDEDIND